MLGGHATLLAAAAAATSAGATDAATAAVVPGWIPVPAGVQFDRFIA